MDEIKSIGFWDKLDVLFKLNPPYKKILFYTHKYQKTIPIKYWEDIVSNSNDIGLYISINDIFENASWGVKS